jgi:hypothetical protein
MSLTLLVSILCDYAGNCLPYLDVSFIVRSLEAAHSSVIASQQERIAEIKVSFWCYDLDLLASQMLSGIMFVNLPELVRLELCLVVIHRK